VKGLARAECSRSASACVHAVHASDNGLSVGYVLIPARSLDNFREPAAAIEWLQRQGEAR
jgi:hypothetical protein